MFANEIVFFINILLNIIVLFKSRNKQNM